MHLLVTIAAHGIGHLAQTAPVLNRLRERLPNLRLSVVSRLPLATLQQQIHGPFAHIKRQTEVGMCMADALSVDLQASLEVYRQWRRRWEQDLEGFGELLRQQRPDLVLSNISYLSLAAARRERIPAIALCSINWADILEGYIAEEEVAELVAPIREAYQQAELFLQCRPHMPMPWLRNARSIGVIARYGVERRQQLLEVAGGNHSRIVLVSLGGIDFPYHSRYFPAGQGILWVLQGQAPPGARDVITTHATGMDFIDIVASVDAWVSKPGYGSFTEAAVNGTPVLYLWRDQWPEEAVLVDWLHEQGGCGVLERQQWEQGRTVDVLEELWQQAPPRTAGVEGIDAAVEAMYLRLVTA